MASRLSFRVLAPQRSSTAHSAAYASSRNTSTSAMYGLSALSNRNETQHLSKLSRLPLMEHSPTLKLIHTSEVELGASSANARQANSLPSESQQQEENEPMGTSAKSVFSPSQRVEEEDKALLADQTRMVEYKKDLAGLKEQAFKRQIQFLRERLDSVKDSLANHQDGFKQYVKDAELDLRTGSRTRWTSPTLQQLREQQQRLVADETARSAGMSALAQYRRNIARLNVQMYTIEVGGFQRQLDSSKELLATAQAFLKQDEENNTQSGSKQWTEQISEGVESDRQESRTTAKQVLNVIYTLTAIAAGAYLNTWYYNREADDEGILQPLRTGGNALRHMVFGEDTHTPQETADARESMLGAASVQDLPSNENNLDPTPEESMVVNPHDSGLRHGDVIKETRDPAQPALQPAKHEQDSSWISLLWKKQ